jgi:prolyl oligopeptidase
MKPAANLRRRRLLALAALPALPAIGGMGFVGPARAQADLPDAGKLPVAPVRNVPETFFGTVVDDPYRDFEDTKAPAVAAWMKAHSDFAHATLKRIPGRDALRARLEDYDSAAAARVTAVQRLGGDLYFFERRGAQDDQFKLYMRRGLDGPDKLLFDPETLRKKTGKPHAINYYSASPDGALVAVGVSAAGSEDAAMRIVDTATGRQRGPEIPRAQFGAIAWAPDASEIYFHRMQALGKGAPATDKYQRSSVVVMKPGGSEAGIRTVLTAGVDLGIPVTEFPIVEVLPDGRVVATAVDGVSPDFAAWHTTLAALRAGQPAWQKLVGREDGVTGLAVQGERVYALSFKGASRLQLLGGALQGFSPATARVLVPESTRVLTGLASALDGLYLEARDGNVKRLYKLAHADGAPLQEVMLPVLGSFSMSNARSHQPGLLLDLQSWTRARQIYAVGADGSVRNTGLQPAGPYDAPGNVVASEVMVKSHDGVMVPMSIIHRQGVKLDGSNPTLLYGYASYGITEEPFFSPSRLAWMDQGGVFAIANPRGSSVFGRQWHDDGKQATKPNTWRDFIACAEYLIAQKWTQPARLGIWGGSAGGILVGRAMTERPDLFAAVVPEVGSLDMVRMETTPNGVPNIPEFGSRKTEAGFRALLAMSTYHQIKDGVAYPAVLLPHGVNDPRVEVWNSTKTAARLLAASRDNPGRKPVLLRLDYESGHGQGSTKSQTLDSRADTFAFLLWQMGVRGFELKV